MLREWDPGTASPTEIDAVLGTLNAVLAADLPDDPQWAVDSFREYLSVTMPGERRICWLAEARPGAAGHGEHPLGHASVLLLGGTGVVEVLVHPAARRDRIGRALIETAARRAAAEGLSSISAEVVGGTPAVGFYESLGFECDFVEVRSVLRLASVDWARLGEQARGVGAGYSIHCYPGGPPEDLYEQYAEAKWAVRTAVGADPLPHDSGQVKASLATLHARGMKPYIVVGVHERTGQVAGLTEVVVPAQHPTRADQYDTVVVPEHRGYGLGRAIKARMLFELRAAEPQLAEVQTWNAVENEALRKVNAELGFVVDREWREYETDLPPLLARLSRTSR
ncbi:MAG TPA: GNAT family N-acetyltransferase [Micromonosporaceae bacterium]